MSFIREKLSAVRRYFPKYISTRNDGGLMFTLRFASLRVDYLDSTKGYRFVQMRREAKFSRTVFLLINKMGGAPMPIFIRSRNWKIKFHTKKMRAGTTERPILFDAVWSKQKTPAGTPRPLKLSGVSR